VERRKVGGLVTLTHLAHLVVRARLIRYQLLVGVAGECVLLVVTTAASLLDLATCAPIGLRLTVSMIENVVRGAAGLYLG